MRNMVITAAAAVLLAFPPVWFLPLFTLDVSFRFWADATEYTMISTLQTLWQADPALALLVSFLALFAPVVKLTGIILIQTGWLSPRALPGLSLMGRLAMADVFLIALAVAMIRGIDGAVLTIESGFWAFAGLVMASVVLGWAPAPGKG